MRRILFTAAAFCAAVAGVCPAIALAADAARVQTDRCEVATAQTPDTGTIESLEREWLASEYRGDVRFLDCLLSPGYQVIVTKKSAVMSKADLLTRVARKQGSAGKSPPPLHTTVVLNGQHATAYSWIADDSGKTIASYVDFYEFHDGRWTAVGGVDL
jgi:hypothetical protein